MAMLIYQMVSFINLYNPQIHTHPKNKANLWMSHSTNHHQEVVGTSQQCVRFG